MNTIHSCKIAILACIAGLALSCSESTKCCEDKYSHEDITIPDSVVAACDAQLLSKKRMIAASEPVYTYSIRIYDASGVLWILAMDPCSAIDDCYSTAEIDSTEFDDGRYYYLEQILKDDVPITESWSCKVFKK